MFKMIAGQLVTKAASFKVNPLRFFWDSKSREVFKRATSRSESHFSSDFDKSPALFLAEPALTSLNLLLLCLWEEAFWNIRSASSTDLLIISPHLEFVAPTSIAPLFDHKSNNTWFSNNSSG